jgi:hypothetical protein
MRPSTLMVGYLVAYAAALALVGDMGFGWTWG